MFVMEDQNSKSKKENLLFQYYLVVFLDILGQRRLLREIKNLPSNEDEKEKFIDKLKKTIGRVDVLRDSFENFFNEFNSSVPNTDLVTPEHRKDFLASQKSETYYYGFSDSIIIAVPLMSKDENCTAINGVYSAFVATCGVGLLALAAKVTLRAGLDVGIATQIEDKEIYGPALERAYFLESQLAEYPRFIVGKELINYVYWVENQQGESIFGMVAKAIAKFCREMIIQDTDGRIMLDFLGRKFKEAAKDSINTDIITRAQDFVNSEYQQYLTEENEKLASRYFRLKRYFDSRVKLWGIK